MHPIQKEKMHNPCILCLRLLHRNRFFSSFAYKPKQQLFYQKGSKDAERGVFYNWVLSAMGMLTAYLSNNPYWKWGTPLQKRYEGLCFFYLFGFMALVFFVLGLMNL
jgi:hypothetical protein